jgi:ribulose-5-phosphate 4-epimerase/fuculose-1-phosphate aldolase
MSVATANIKDAKYPRPADMSPEEWQARVQLAACYRLFDYFGWYELIFNHITLRVPGPERHFLINPFGLLYREVTASNLVKIDLDGNVIGKSNWPINPAGYTIHSAIHGAVENAHCVMHTHTTTGLAVACKREGLSMTNFYSAQLLDQVAYHDFEGITVVPDEKERMLANIGDKRCVILRNHGLLAWGESVAEAFVRLWTLQRACDIQVMTEAMCGDTIPVTEEAARQATAVAQNFTPGHSCHEDVFAAMQRLMDARDPSYRS